ncbi:MAG: 2'-deoxycytidine 5'-triphosphate deaminase [Patescibacteria group bacterium]|jgi:dCTP deaminase
MESTQLVGIGLQEPLVTQQGAVLVDWQLRELLEQGRITGMVESSDIQPCSLDLRTGNRMWEVAGIPDLKDGFNSQAFIEEYGYNSYSEEECARNRTLTSGTYLVELGVRLDFQPDEWGYINPKSSAGRIDLHCIVLVEGGTQFNVVPRGYKGKLFAILVPQSFYVKLQSGVSLTQLRIFRGERKFFDNQTLRELHGQYGLIENPGLEPVIDDDHLMVRVDLKSDPSNLVVTGTRKPISLTDKGTIEPRTYFRVKQLDDHGGLWLEPDEFALLTTIEKVRIPVGVCAEMVSFADVHGELRSHYAGFFDRGFGYGVHGEVGGNTAVCEVRNKAAVPVRLSHGQLIARFKFEHLNAEPKMVYGVAGKGSNYGNQSTIKLAKFFASWSD